MYLSIRGNEDVNKLSKNPGLMESDWDLLRVKEKVAIEGLLDYCCCVQDN